MQIKINCTMDGKEVLEHFYTQLKANNIDQNPDNIKIFVINKTGQEVEVGADKIKLVYNKE
ncbi:MAG: hypothetical protein Q7R95_06155 [bacterium]|nr:hypothetical protein [bacterium]